MSKCKKNFHSDNMTFKKSIYFKIFKKLAPQMQLVFQRAKTKLFIELHKYARPGLGRAFFLIQNLN